MSATSAFVSIIFMLSIFLIGSRDSAFAKDFFYFDPSIKIRRLLYIRRIPVGKISLSSIAMQCLIILTIVLQVLSLLGTNILKPILSIVWFGKYTFAHSENPYFQIIFCIGGIFLPGAIFIILYFLICALFAPRR